MVTLMVPDSVTTALLPVFATTKSWAVKEVICAITAVPGLEVEDFIASELPRKTDKAAVPKKPNPIFPEVVEREASVK